MSFGKSEPNSSCLQDIDLQDIDQDDPIHFRPMLYFGAKKQLRLAIASVEPLTPVEQSSGDDTERCKPQIFFRALYTGRVAFNPYKLKALAISQYILWQQGSRAKIFLSGVVYFQPLALTSQVNLTSVILTA